jgi:hypothetical protein
MLLYGVCVCACNDAHGKFTHSLTHAPYPYLLLINTYGLMVFDCMVHVYLWYIYIVFLVWFSSLFLSIINVSFSYWLYRSLSLF